MFEKQRAVAAYLRNLKHLRGTESGQDMIEYAMLIGFIALLAVATLMAIGTSISTIFDTFAGLFSP